MEAEGTDKIIKELIDFFDNRTILEVACGTGAFSHEVDRVANRIQYDTVRVLGLQIVIELVISDPILFCLPQQ